MRDITDEERDCSVQAEHDRVDAERTEDENELICVFMGWQKSTPRSPPTTAFPNGKHAVWFNGRVSFETPSFTAWSTVGWLADRFRELRIDFALFLDSFDGAWSVDLPRANEYIKLGEGFDNGPAALRASALAVANMMKDGKW